MLWAASADPEASGRRCALTGAVPFVVALLLLGSLLAHSTHAEHHVEPFESAVRSWVLTAEAPRHLLVEHRRQRMDVHSGLQAELIQFDSPGLENPFSAVHFVRERLFLTN